MMGFAALISVAAGISASSDSIGVTEEEMKAVMRGRSVTKNVLGKPVYNDDQEKIGVIEDLIITRQRWVPYAIIGVGGFLGIGKHEVAIQMSKLKEEKSGFFAPRGSRYAIRAMPRFEYEKP
jgi:hypothetical protein